MARQNTGTVTLSTKIEKTRIADLLCSALEGGSNYWYMIEKFIKPAKVERQMFGDQTFRHIDYPLSEGGAIMVSDERGCGAEKDKTTTRVDLPRLLEGLRIMQEKYPHHYANWLAENDDAETGDVFLQCCVFGETIYG